ncbi:MAG: discoidin domain-containing protein [Verrucomicrobiota bacterium]
MKRFLVSTLILTLSLAGTGFSQLPGLDAPVAIGAYLNGTLPPVAPGASTGWSTVNAFPNLTFVDPLWLTPVPGTGDLLLVGKNGQLWRFANNPATTQGQVVKVLEWVANTQSSEDQGFYSLAFHPEFGQGTSPNKDYVYVCYNHKPALAGADSNHSYWRVSRFTWLTASGTLNPASESVLISQYDPDLWHNGGAMFFDNAGYLNITCGDGGDSGAGGGLAGALGRTQKLNAGLFSGIFRIDVDNSLVNSHAIRRQPLGPTPPAGWPASFTQGYRIPNDNPFLDPAGTILEEYSALGLRSPHTAHYDPIEDEVWLGDVGEVSREEISRLTRGDNAQWGYKEGSITGPGTAAAPPLGTDTPSYFDYTRSVGSCIIGGMRYRGTLWNSLLGGKVLYGDHAAGKIWSIAVDPGGMPVPELLVDGYPTGNKVGLANFCTDAAGEIYLMNVNGTNVAGGTIRRLVSAGVSTEPPPLLSQTGIFSNLANLTPSSGVIPFNVATPLWSDGAAKQRWIALPNNGSHDTAAEDIAFSEEGNWVFPAGTVLIKHFEIGTNLNDPSQIKRLETRLIVCTANGGKYGVTYKWNAAGTDATLLTTGVGEDYNVIQIGGGTVTQHWDYPSRADCLQCHNNTSGQALGVRTASLAMDFHYGSTNRTANQLLTFNSLGMFDRTLTTTELENFIESRAIDDTSAPLEHRVRSYLASNCSHCHQPGGTVPYFDARLGTPLIQQGLINGAIQGHFVLENGRYLKPGDPALSAVHVRLGSVGNGAAMPPLAKNIVDQEAVDLLTQYITGLNDAQFQTTGSVQARYVRLTALSEVNGNAWTSVAEFSILDGTGTPIPPVQLTVSDFDSQELAGENAPATMAIDGNTGTFWHTQWQGGSPPPPHHLTIDLGSPRAIGGYVYTPRQGNANGRIAGYQVDSSTNGTSWTPIDSGTWANDANPKSFTGLVGMRKARCEIAGPAGTLSGNFDVTIAFDTDVTDFSASDLQISGGTVTKLRGSGYYYVATIAPVSAYVSVSVPADVANNALLGNFASNALNLGDPNAGPVAVFTGLPPGSVNGPVSLGIQFDKVPVGFSITSLSATNAGLSALAGGGTSYSVLVSPVAEGPFSVSLNPAGITDSQGHPMTVPLTANLAYKADILHVEAENGILAGGMTTVSDTSTSAGHYIWLPDGSYPNNEQGFNAANSATYTFVLPRSGNWILEGLLRSDNASGNSLWAKVDGGTTYTWDTNTGQIGTGVFTWDQLSNAATIPPTATLIDSATRNGSFELLGTPPGAVSAAKATHWDTDPDGDVTYWTLFPGVTAFDNSGSETNAGLATQGTKLAFMQTGNAAYNMTDHVIQAGDVFTFRWDSRNTVAHNVSLIYNNGGTPTALGTAVTSTTTGLNKTGTYTVLAGHACIGKTAGIKIAATANFPNLDNVRLTVTPSPTPLVDPVILNLTAGTHTVTVYGREDGTRLDALRFTSERPLVTLAAPAVSVGGGNIAVAVAFSESVTGLTSGDFTLNGATFVSLTGSAANYTLTVAPAAAVITLTLPEGAAIDSSSNPSFDSNTATVVIRTLFEQWALDSGMEGAGYQDDPNGDGLPALLEFLLNLDPHAAAAVTFNPANGPTGLPKASIVNQRLRIEFPRDPAAVAAGYRYIAQFSGDFQNWDDLEAGVLVPMNDGWDHMTIEDPNPTGGKRFARLKLVSP